MQNYPVRPDHRKNLEVVALGAIARRHLEQVEVGETDVRGSFGAIESLVAKAAGRELAVEVRMNPRVEEGVARETIARYNRFLEEVTGYTSKERARRLRKSAGA